MKYTREFVVSWGESDPFGLVYFPNMLAWFNDTEHDLFREIGFPVDKMIAADQTTFVMGEISFRFIGPAPYASRVCVGIALEQLRDRTLHWICKAHRADDSSPVMTGRATRVYAHIGPDKSLKSANIPADMRAALTPFQLETPVVK